MFFHIFYTRFLNTSQVFLATFCALRKKKGGGRVMNVNDYEMLMTQGVICNKTPVAQSDKLRRTINVTFLILTTV